MNEIQIFGLITGLVSFVIFFGSFIWMHHQLGKQQ